MYRNYKISSQVQFYIDKTQEVEERLRIFPAVYLEGAASSGKTTAVQMLLEKHPEVLSVVVRMDDKRQRADLGEILNQMQMKKGCTWIVFENLPKELSAEEAAQIAEFICSMPEDARAILVCREKPAVEFLELFWKRKMEILSQDVLLFTEAQVREYLEAAGSRLPADEVFAVSGGWAGCVDVLVRMSSMPEHSEKTVKELKECYEISAYIQKWILGTLSSAEQEVIRCAQQSPWISEELCSQVWGIQQSRELLEDLERKGFLLYDKQKKGWTIAPLLEDVCASGMKEWDVSLLGHWYEEKGFLKEALECFEKAGDGAAYRNCMTAHYDAIPLQKISYDCVKNWKEDTPQICYLRGMNAYEHQQFGELRKEIEKVKRMEPSEFLRTEVLINLCYVNPDMELEDWLAMLERELPKKFRLYHVLGYSHMYLCGLRDLTQMFVCSKKEENRKAKIWKAALGQEEIRCYYLARNEYYIETQREDKLERDSKLFESPYAAKMQNIEKLVHWMRDMEKNGNEESAEENYIVLYWMTKGYMMLGQYDKAGKIIDRLLPYLKAYRRERLVAELLFARAVVWWDAGKHGAALQSTIESFLISRKYRYVKMYTGYGKAGEEVLSAYMEWMQAEYPESWSRKKKYQYGNVLRMPETDYMEVVLRCMKRWHRKNPAAAVYSVKERLTMMENIVLQEIGKGLTNAEICQVLNLKLPTVKAHIYSVYKKLDVKNRMQAVLKGKELGILDDNGN